MTFDHRLGGCVPAVLATYLKALAVHRLIAEQADASARSHWDDDGIFHLVTILGPPELLDFFLRRYVPTPVVTPWNGGSGFYPGDQKAGIEPIRSSRDDRFGPYRETLGDCNQIITRLGLREKPDKDQKLVLLRQARSSLPDPALAWLDAAYAVGDDARYPALLGTGGNDGRLDFANNFMQRLAELFIGADASQEAAKEAALASALFDRPVQGALEKVAVGQFAPGLAGGPNMTAGIEADARVNPWDYVLAIEGALAFAGAAVRRMEAEARGSASFPFHVEASAVGYGSSADPDESAARSEIWLPLWSEPAVFPELRLLFAEGRLELGRRRARNGLEAVQALALLGADRGIDRFQRIGILRRNGLSYLASFLGTFAVQEEPSVELLGDLAEFLDACDRLANPPEAVRRTLRRLRVAMFDVSRRETRLTEVLAAVGALERAVSRSPKAREGVRRPLTGLRPEWSRAADDGSPEFAIAAALASWRWRTALEPVDETQRRWTEARPRWSAGNALENIATVASRRLLEAEMLPFVGQSGVTADALLALLAATLSHERLTDLIFGLALVRDLQIKSPAIPRLEAWPDSTFALLRAVTSPRILPEVTGDPTRHPASKVIAHLLARLAAHDLEGAVSIAERRLRASRLPLRAPVHPVRGRRDYSALAVSLVVPLPEFLERQIVQRVVALGDGIRVDRKEALA